LQSVWVLVVVANTIVTKALKYVDVKALFNINVELEFSAVIIDEEI